MSFRNTFILAIIFVLLAGFLVKMKWQGIEQKVERIFVFNPQEVEEIRLTKDKQTIVLRKEEKEWKVSMLTKTGSARPIADKKIVHSLLSVFDYGILDVIHDHPTNLSDFGLDNPEFEVSIKVKGDPLKTLLIGSDNPTQNSCYAKVETLPRVLLLGILYKTDLDSIFDRLYSHADGQSKMGRP
jgi:hypothetical protein